MTKTLRILLAALFCTSILPAEETPAAPKPLKIAFWNVEWFPGRHPNPTNVESIAQRPPSGPRGDRIPRLPAISREFSVEIIRF